MIRDEVIGIESNIHISIILCSLVISSVNTQKANLKFIHCERNKYSTSHLIGTLCNLHRFSLLVSYVYIGLQHCREGKELHSHNKASIGVSILDVSHLLYSMSDLNNAAQSCFFVRVYL